MSLKWIKWRKNNLKILQKDKIRNDVKLNIKFVGFEPKTLHLRNYFFIADSYFCLKYDKLTIFNNTKKSPICF